MSSVIVIAEANRNSRALGITLELAGHEVVQAQRGSVGALLAQTLKPELVLLDTALAGPADASALCRLLKSRSPALRVLLVGTLPSPAHVHGADGWVPLPFDPVDLLDEVARQLTPALALEPAA